MNLQPVAEELRTALGAIAGLRRPPWGAKPLPPPAALIGLPERIDYDVTHGRGADKIPDLAVIILGGKPKEPASYKLLAAYADGSGPKSVKAALEAFAYTTCDRVRVTSVDFDEAEYERVAYLSAIFHLEIIGKGVV